MVKFLFALARLLLVVGAAFHRWGDAWQEACRRTWLQSFVFAAMGGPLVWLMGLGDGCLLWCIAAMGAAPPLVDFLKGARGDE